MNDVLVRILFVDDDALVLRSLERAVRVAQQVECTFTTDADDVLRLLGERRFDIIVSDQVMPSMSGTDLLGLVRRLHPEVMRVMLTGEIDRQLAIDAINESRVQGFIEKPWNNERLRAVLGGFIADARARHRARIDTAIDAVA